jgi:hypothetical protein
MLAEVAGTGDGLQRPSTGPWGSVQCVAPALCPFERFPPASLVLSPGGRGTSKVQIRGLASTEWRSASGRATTRPPAPQGTLHRGPLFSRLQRGTPVPNSPPLVSAMTPLEGPMVASISQGNRLARPAIPHDGGLSLIRDSDHSDIGRADGGARQRLPCDVQRRADNLTRIMLYPPRSRMDLLELALCPSDDGAFVIDDDRPRVRRSLVQGEEERHRHVYQLNFSRAAVASRRWNRRGAPVDSASSRPPFERLGVRPIIGVRFRAQAIDIRTRRRRRLDKGETLVVARVFFELGTRLVAEKD